MLANAEVSPDAVVIVPSSGVSVNANIPPFKSFFLNRILEGMKSKDAEKVNQGALRESDALNYKVEEDDGGIIKCIVINNYRDKDRLQEIFNTSTWVITRMLEKSRQLKIARGIKRERRRHRERYIEYGQISGARLWFSIQPSNLPADSGSKRLLRIIAIQHPRQSD